MADHRVVVRISAAADGSLRTAFTPLEQSAQRARAKVAKESQAAGQAVAKEAQRGAQAADRANDAMAKMFAKREAEATKATEKASQQRTRAALKEFDERAKASAKARREEEKDIEDTAKKAERAEQRKRDAAEKTAKERMRSFGENVRSNIGSLGRGAISLGRDIAGGMGVDFSIQSQVGKAVSTNRTIVDTTNSGFIAKGQNAAQADVLATTKAVEAAGDSSKIAYGDMANALKTYVERTGELEEGKSMLASMGDIAQATGSRVEDVAAAAGSMSKAMGDVPNKAQKVQELLRSIAFQGAAGSVEIRQLAAQMPKVTSQAFLFGGKGGLSREAAIGQLGALAQFSVVGGAANASQATTSVAAFTDIIEKTRGKKAAQIKAEYGIDFARERNAKGEAMNYKSPQQIIKEVLASTGGSPEALAKIFGNVRGAKPGLGLAQAYTDAGGGKAGEAAIDEIFQKYAKGMTDEQVKSAADLAKNSPEAKAEAFNNNLQKIAERLVNDVLPAFDKITPTITEFLTAFEDVIGWAAQNPGEAITLAIVGSIAKAAVGEAISGALKGALSGAGGGGFAGLSSALGVATAAVAGFAAGMALVDAGFSQKSKGEADEFKKQANSQNLKGEFLSGNASAQALMGDTNAILGRIKAGSEGGLSKYDAANLTGGIDYASVALNKVSNGSFGESSESQRNKRAEAGQLGTNITDFVTALQTIKDKAPAGSEELKQAAAELSAAAKVFAMAGVAMPGSGRSNPGSGLGPQ